jgi:CheY-like chemotaxis protein
MKKILIVEDVEMNIELLVQLLEDDYRLAVAKDGASGVSLAAQELPDLIMMDMSLPEMNGWEATRLIKSDPALRNIPVIGLSAHAMSGDEAKAREAGCDDYLTKPIDEDRLFSIIEQHLGRVNGPAI